MAEKKEGAQFQHEELDLKGILVKYLKYWYWFVAGVVVCLSLAFLYLRYATPQYQISSTLLIKDDKNAPDLSGNVAFSDLDIFKSTKNIHNEIPEVKIQYHYFFAGKH